MTSLLITTVDCLIALRDAERVAKREGRDGLLQAILDLKHKLTEPPPHSRRYRNVLQWLSNRIRLYVTLDVRENPPATCRRCGDAMFLIPPTRGSTKNGVILSGCFLWHWHCSRCRATVEIGEEDQDTPYPYDIGACCALAETVMRRAWQGALGGDKNDEWFVIHGWPVKMMGVDSDDQKRRLRDAKWRRAVEWMGEFGLTL